VPVSIDVELKDRTGALVQRIAGQGNLLSDALPAEGDDSYHCLGYIDPYDETAFNEPQVTRLITELERRSADVPPEQASYLTELADVARRAEREHLRLVFVGD
jgi:hypothetical protein